VGNAQGALLALKARFVKCLQSKVSADTWAWIGEKKLKDLQLGIGPFEINGVQLVLQMSMC
jgi:hypothetical protein